MLHSIYNTTTASSSVYTVSAYVKANGKNVAWYYISNSGSTNGTNNNLDDFRSDDTSTAGTVSRKWWNTNRNNKWKMPNG